MTRFNRLAHATILILCAATAGCVSGPDSGVKIVKDTRQRTLADRLLGRESAEARYQAAVEEVSSKPADPVQLSLSYAKLMEESHNTAEAEAHYQKVLDRQPKNVTALVGLARIHQNAGRHDLADQEFRKALKFDSHCAAAQHGLGQLYASQERWSEAVEWLNKAVVEQPNEKSYRHHLAVALVQSNQVEAALPHFIRTVGDAEAHYNVGLILHQKGRIAESEEQFRLALSRKPDLEQAQYWLDLIARTPRSSGGHSSAVQTASHAAIAQ